MSSTRRQFLGRAFSAETVAPDHTLVVVFQRFASDWMNLLVPAGDPRYEAIRPNIAITNPLDLDGWFGLHPGLEPLLDLYRAGSLGFVTATGWTAHEFRDRSHFHAQTLAETAPESGARGGWLGRVMSADPAADGVWAAIAAEKSLPASLQGFPGALALENFAGFTHGSRTGAEATSLIGELAGIAGEGGATALKLADAVGRIEQAPPEPSTLVYPATTLGRGLKTAAEAIKAGLAPRVVAVTSSDDWDTHVDQVRRHDAALPGFAGAIRAFHDDLADRLDRVTLVTMTEFGRKAKENLSGTDHGTASSMMVMGGAVAGGQVLGDWPGLEDDQLFDGEDLEPTTDFRSVLGELVAHQLGSDGALEEIFPGGAAARSHWVGVLGGA